MSSRYTLTQMAPDTKRSRDLVDAIAPRFTDLRSEFEAQLRAVARVEQQLAATTSRVSVNELSTVLHRALGDLLHNNANIREVLIELAAITDAATTA